jgi:hypothetical protein
MKNAQPGVTPVGDTIEYVEGRGFTRLGRSDLLIAKDGTKRVVAELIADYSDPLVHPQNALLHIIRSMKPGWAIRFTQVYWPDGELREALINHVKTHMSPGTANEARAILYEGLMLALDPEEIPLTYARRTFIEFFVSNNDTLYWWETLGNLLAQNCRIQMIYMDVEAVTSLARWILNPLLDTRV